MYACLRSIFAGCAHPAVRPPISETPTSQHKEPEPHSQGSGPKWITRRDNVGGALAWGRRKPPPAHCPSIARKPPPRTTDRAHVFTLDTGFLFEETIRYRKDATKRYSLALEVLTSQRSVEEQVERYGPELHSCKPDLSCQVRKIETQRRCSKDYGAWSTGIRRDPTE